MASIAGSVLKSLGSISSSLSSLAPNVFRGVGQDIKAVTSHPSKTWTPLVTSVRHRYHADRRKNGPLVRNHAERVEIQTTGMLPHLVHGKRLPIPLYKPKNAWSERRALFGQNDYIDILGDGSLKPTDVSYSVPPWMRGFKGNEFQMLLRKRKLFESHMRSTRPSKHRDMNKRIKYLYRYLNQKTKDYYWHKA
ncbi:unnamed protein product [Meganyctiphanes norvegica]|uniref:Large ribosomal subunit protein mL51 n=1 Tax=Meganyctiphanes norvegica TaxID=48144 RepID=A0AAV2SEK6_MEGNR